MIGYEHDHRKGNAMNPIEELKVEHEGIKGSLEILDTITRDLSGPDRDGRLKDLEKLAEFYSVFVDQCHHGKEEELLFPALEAIGISREGGPIGVMLHEHDLGRAHVAGIKKAIAQFPENGPAAAAAIRHHAEGYTRLLLQHIEKENHVLFRIADEHLPADKKNEIDDGFQLIERDRVGSGRHEQFHRLLDELRAKYGK
jgi:hemerythrin-like domain-containing protein